MANPTSNFGWQMPQNTDLVKDLPADFEVFGQAVDTSLMDLKGGTTGQVLSKASNTDMDFTWVAQDDSNAIQNALLTTTGDTIYASGASTPARLGIGSTGQVLTVSGGLPSWQTPTSGSMTLLSTTTLSGSSTTISSINQTYKDLEIWIRNVSQSSNNNVFDMEPNGATASTDNILMRNTTPENRVVTGNNSTTVQLSGPAGMANNNTNNFFRVRIVDYTSTAHYKVITYESGFQSANDGAFTMLGMGFYRANTAVSSLDFNTPGTATGGTVLIYGVN